MVSGWASPRYRKLMTRIDKLGEKIKTINAILDAPRRIRDFENRLDALENATKRRRTQRRKLNIHGRLADVMPYTRKRRKIPTVLLPRSEGSSELSRVSLRDVMKATKNEDA